MNATQIYFILASLLAITLFATTSFASVSVATGGIIDQFGEGREPLNNSTQIIYIRTGGDVTTLQYLVDMNNNLFTHTFFYIASSRFYMKATCFSLFGCDDAEYYVSGINPDTTYILAWRWNLQAPEGEAPTVWINGVQQTVTTVTTGTSSVANDLNRTIALGENALTNSQNFGGSISAYYMAGAKLPDSAMETITGTTCLDQPLAWNTPDNNFLHGYTFTKATTPITLQLFQDEFGDTVFGQIPVLTFIGNGGGMDTNYFGYCGVYN